MNPPNWIKSSRSHQNGACIELTEKLDQLRDSKDPHGPTLTADIRRFLQAIKSGRFDR